MAINIDLETRNFLRNIAKYEQSFFLTPWAGVIVRNCDASEDFIMHSTTQSYIHTKIPFGCSKTNRVRMGHLYVRLVNQCLQCL